MGVQFAKGNTVYKFRNPEFGNRNDLSFERIFKRSRGNDLIIKANGPTNEVLVIPFDFADEPERQLMLKMLKETLGEQLIYTDHEGNQWRGFIQNPAAAMNQPRRFAHTCEINFEGELL